MRQLRATVGPCPCPCPCPPLPAPILAKAPAPAPRTDPPRPLTPSRLRPGLTQVVMAAGSAPVGSPTGWAQGSDPQCGSRVSIRPQPKRAPRGEVMALGPSRWVGSARAVAWGPTQAWVGRSMGRGQAAAALRLSLALCAARGV